jgi:hypothetical protein
VSRSGYTVDTAVQDAERALDRKLTAIELADLEELLRQPWGRRLYYRFVFTLGRLEAPSFDPGIKDGVCSAIHMGRNEGLREYAAVLANEAQAYFPIFWLQMLQERVAAAELEQRKRYKARNPTTTEGDT